MEEKERLRRTLRRLLPATAVGAAVFLLIGWVAHLPDVIAMAVLVLVSDLGMWMLLRRGYLTLPRIWLPTLLLLMITHSIARTDGLHARGVFLYPVIIAIAGLLLGQWGVALFGALSIVAVTGIAWAEVTGRLITVYSADVTWTSIVVTDALLAGVTVIFYLTIHNLMLSLVQMRRSEQALHAAQAELRQERDTAQMYLDVAGVIMLALDADARVQLINQKGLATLACELEDIIGQNWFDTFVPAHDRERARATFKQLLNGPLTPDLESFENTIVTRSGAERLIAWHNVVLWDATGRATGTFSSGEDITAREQAQQQVRESNARYRALFEQANDAIWVADQDDNILDANPRGCQLLGYTRDELLTMRITDLQAPEVRGQTGSVIRTELARSQGTPFEALDLHRDGTPIPVEVTTSPLSGGLVLAIVRDITERKQAEEALRESETRLRALAESAQDGIVMMDPAGHISFWNPAAAALCGYTAEEALGQHLHTLLAPEWYHAAYAAAFPRFQETGCGAAVGQTLELEARCKDGRIVPVELSLSAMALSDGWHAVGIMRDITARKQAEEAVRESEEKFRALAENSLDVIMRFDRAHRHLYVNAAAATTGIPAADFIGKTHAELGFPAHLVELWAAAIDTVFTSGASHRIEFQLPNQTWIDWLLIPEWGEAGAVKSVVTSARDITQIKKAEAALRESEARYRRLVDNAPIGILAIDARGQVTEVNPKMLEILGSPSAEATRAINVLTFPPLVASGLADDLRECLETGANRSVERFYQSRWGKAVYLRIQATPIKEADGSVSGVQTVVEDISERKQVEAQHAAALAELQEAKRRLDDIINFLPEATFVIDREGRVIAWNRAIEKMTGVSREEMLGQGDLAYTIPFYGEKRPILIDMVFAPDDAFGKKQYQNIQRTGDTYFAEAYVPRVYNGRGAYLWGTASLLRNANGDIVGAIESIHDITARRQAEEAVRESELKYRTLIDQSASIVLEWNAEGRILFLNQYGLEFFGFTADEIIGQNLVGTLVPPVDSTGYDLGGKIGRIQQQPDAYRSAENENIRKNGERVWVAWTNKGIYAPDGRLLKTLSIGIDRTRQKEMERKLREHEQQIAQQNQAFVALVGNKRLYAGDKADALQMITEAAARGLAAQRASIWFYTPDQAGIYCADLYALDAAQHTHGGELYARDFPAYFAALQNEVMIAAEDAHLHPHTAEFSATYLTPLGIGAMLDIPIRAGGRMAGVLCCEHVGGPRAWSLEEQSFGAAIAGVISTVLEAEERQRAENALRQANAELSARLEELAMLNQITQTVATRLDLTHILNSVAEMMLHRFDVSAVMVSMLNAERNGLTLMAHLTRAAGAPSFVGQVLSLADAHLFTKLQEQKQPYVITRTDPNKPLRSVHHELSMPDVQCLLNVPLTSRDAVIGVITLTSERPDCAFTANQINLAGAIAGQVAGAIENARLFAETQRRAEHLALLNRIGVTVTTGLEMTQVLRSLYEQCRQIVALDCFYVALYEEATGMMHFPFFYDHGQPVQTRARHIQDKPGLTGLVIEAGQTVYIPDTLSPEETRAEGIVRTGGTPIRSYVGVPLKVRQKVIGVLSMQSYAPDAYTAEQIGLLETIAAQAAFAVDNARLYDAALEAQRAAEAANRAKSVFLANMSHELRTPLNAVLGFTQLMANDANLTAMQRENLSIMSRSGEHLLALINDVLEMSKIETGRVELRLERFDVRHMLRGLEEMFQLRARQKGLTLTFDLADDVPQYIHADEGKLRQVLINLLSNAVKFTETGGVTLRVKRQMSHVKSQAPATFDFGLSTLDFEVTDTGVGIAPEEMEMLFTAFTQTSSGRKSGEGTGLGLPISQQYARLMGGELRVSSTPGRGSCFAFDLPLTADVNGVVSNGGAVAERVPTLRQIIGLTPGQHAPDGEPYRLLVVEDVSANRKLLVDLLHSWRANDEGHPGFDVREAINGQEAVTQWAAWHPHLIWMDIRMPVLDGYEATRQIRARAKAESVPAPVIVALTAGAFEEERARILAEGCDDFVRKPFQQAEIGAILDKHLGLRFAYRETPAADPYETAGNGVSSGVNDADLRAVLTGQSAAWLETLRQAAVQGDPEWMMSLIGEIQDAAPALAQQLAEWVANFEHSRILELLVEAG